MRVPITSATIVDGTGAVPTTDSCIEIEDHRIVAVHDRPAVTYDRSDLVIDAQGAVVLPGVINDHAHGCTRGPLMIVGGLPEDAINALQASVDEMNRRYELFKSIRVRSLEQFNESSSEAERISWRLVVLDEYADLTSDPDERKQIEAVLKRVAQKGRAAGIHLIGATQKPSAEVLSTVIRSNLPAQLALRVKSSTDSRIILDEAGAESLAGKGDAFLKTAKGMTRVQCSMFSPDSSLT